MSVKKHIQNFRSQFLKYNFIGNLIYIGLIGSVLFLLLIFLESIFYFSPKTKLIIIYTIVISSTAFTIYWLAISQLIKRESIKSYEIKKFAMILGEKLFPNRKDTILNAMQLEYGSKEHESESLANAYITSILQKLKNFDFTILIVKKNRSRLKWILLFTWSFVIIIFSFNYQLSSESFSRLQNPNKVFHAPKPFKLLNTTGTLDILAGERPTIIIKSSKTIADTIFLLLTPTQVSTKKRDSLRLKFHSLPNNSGEYLFELPELYQDYAYQAIVKARSFWESWGSVSTKLDTIFVTDRPSFENFALTITPPKYSKLEKFNQEGNLAAIKSLKGSEILINVTANRALRNAYLILNQEKVNMVTNNNSASGKFTLVKEGNFNVNLVDNRGITNRDPIGYSLEIIPDINPMINIIKPPPVIELGNDQTIPIHLDLMDDFGFTNLQLAYEIKKPAYIQDNTLVAMLKIDELEPDSLIQSIKILWELDDLYLMPDDEVHFHFELTDNDNISGPKKTISNTFIARVPSLTDLFESITDSEEQFFEDMSQEFNDIKNLRDEFESLELKMLKEKELDWDQKQSIQNIIEETKKEINKLEKLSESIESITSQADKHKLFNSDLLTKFEELSKLINDIIPENMQNNLKELQQALDELDIQTLQESLRDLANNMEQIESDLDRYLDIFKRFQAEQKLDEIQKRLQQLFEQQNALSNQIKNLSSDIDMSTSQRHAEEQQRISNEFENILSLIDEASSLVEPFSKTTSEQLKSLSESDLSSETESLLEQTEKSLKKMELQNAQNMSAYSAGKLDSMMQEMSNIQQSFQKETVAEMAQKFEKLMQKMLYLSSQEEDLKSELKNTYRNSPRLKKIAAKQQVLQDQLQSITNQMMELSKETFAITPEIGRGIGKANVGMQQAKEKLTERNTAQAEKSQTLAMQGLNEAAVGLFNSIENMKKSGSASGVEQFMQMMQQMAGQQQGLNQQGLQLALGKMAAAAQQQMMQQMMKGQKGLRKSLEQLMNEMRQSGGNKLGDLSGIAKEMDEVIKDLQKNKYDQKTQSRQQKILSRMLDSQVSMTQRGEKDRRKSSSAKLASTSSGPDGLPVDLGQLEDLILRALNSSMKAGYSKEHQTMIKRYFNFLSRDNYLLNNADDLNE